MKYGNRKVQTADGCIHDSQKEANRWMQLKLYERAKVIKDLKRQVRYTLIPKQDGERACEYIADFVYTDCKSGETIVEDTKGVKTKAYIIKRKLMLYVHGIKIKEL